MSDTQGSLRDFRAGKVGFAGQTHAVGNLSVSPAAPVNGANLAFNGTQWESQAATPYYGTNTATNAGTSCVTIGDNASTLANTQAVAIGTNASAVTGPRTVAIGYNASATGLASDGWGVAVGTGAHCTADYAVALGNTTTAGGSNSLCAGSLTSTVGVGDVALGYGAGTSGGNTNVAIGYGTTCVTAADASVAIGSTSSANSAQAIAIGSAARANAARTVAIGRQAVASNSGDVNLGYGATSVAGSSLNLATANAVVVAAAGASDAYLLVSINGVQYKLLLHT